MRPPTAVSLDMTEFPLNLAASQFPEFDWLGRGGACRINATYLSQLGFYGDGR